MPYRGTGDQNTRVDRPDEGLPTEFPGPGGTGTSRATFDDAAQGNPRYKGAKTQIQTDGFSVQQDQDVARAINTA
jgi:hypothetical protein